ncbi:Alpha-2-macroglobulin [Legionella beliardensis]|uniref:Alpha-2-macroglobulin n=1 Tax=Legionella beliardensis TaxID=91822 RepID=A0A378I0X0_9GAMM|nr:alpha-2-macroglobulin [Legionella beliardensis]STX28799.1 Alpha-2-macroglobulin [Legionella beliardensis]
MNDTPIAKKKTKFNSFLALILGQVHWSSPPWIGYLQRKAKNRPGLFWSITVFLLLGLLTALYSYHWYINLPKPQLITANIAPPKITPLADTLKPDILGIDFGLRTDKEFIPKSVAPLELVDKEVSQYIQLKPALKGVWAWEGDHRLVFTPDEDWPAGQTYTIQFGKEFFAKGTRMESLAYSFSTEPFQAQIKEFKFYQDPVDPKVRQAVATVDFNFPVDSDSFEKKVSLLLQDIKNEKLNLAAQHFKWTVDYDEHKRTAYIRSETLPITAIERYLVLTIDKGVKSSTGSSSLAQEITKNLLIPDAASYFKITNTAASIVRNEQDRPEQVLTIESSIGITDTQVNKSLHVYLLSENYPATKLETEKLNYEWQNPGEVTPAILSLAKPIALQPIPADRNYATLHSYKFNVQGPRYLYLKIDKGARAFGNFALTNDYAAIIKVPELPKEISFLHKGALLALSGEKKLSVLVRGVPAVKFEIARVLPGNINQLITQTEGDFNNPRFVNYTFNQQNISEIFSEVQSFDDSDLTKQQYTALDLTKYLSAPVDGMKGLFLLKATGWDLVNKNALDVRASRLILITDLGMLVKDNSNGSHDVFVESITGGNPIAGVEVSILGKNGLPIFSSLTDNQGRVSFPTLKDFIDDREPVVYLARLGNDVSFIPYNNANRQLNYSRFDVGGLYSNNQELPSLSAYLFSDRGIYRPGDVAHLGMVIKQAYAQPQPPGLPLEAIIVDPRGTTVYDQKYTLDATGFLSFDFKTNPSSPTGQYSVYLYTVKDKHTESILGNTTIKVAEFQPDRMRITTQILPTPSTAGWIAPAKVTAHVNLWNLYGAPAENRRVGAKILLTPQKIEFEKYPSYIFSDPLLDPAKPAKVYTETLSDNQTNDKGEANFDLRLDRFEKATYQLTFFAEGFEAEGGRSVTAQAKTLISPLPYFIGYKPDGALNYIKQNSIRELNFIAVNPKLNLQSVSNLKIQLLSLRPVSTLVKNANGTYQYQSVIQTKVVNTNPIAINEQGTNYTLPTDQIGDFALSILDENNVELNRIKFSVVGTSQLPLAKNAELNVKLNKAEYSAGDEIELQVTAPYTGSGLITIERDKVYATQWFKTDTTSSVQRIHIPENFQGNGYVNIAFIRDWNSPELFISPLSYNVIPFKLNHDNHAVHIQLDTAKLVKPGDNLTIKYSTDKPGKIIVFAVDEGILQVVKYPKPDPLAFFFQKRALEVLTQQTVDQILPKYIRERELSTVGGDGSEELLAAHLNPFKRKTDLPVVFWSGIVTADSNQRELIYQIPNYFNGSIKVMAVAVADNAVGSTDKSLEVRGNFIINPNVPTFVTPNDNFEITASVANNIQGSGDKTPITVKLLTTPGLEIIGPNKATVNIGEGHEGVVQFKVRAKSDLGSAKVTLEASLNDKTSKMDATLSIRPASPFITTVDSQVVSDVQKTVNLTRNLYSEYRQVNIAASTNPLILVNGLQHYLDNFPYGCTEQLTSKAMPLLAMANKDWYLNIKDKSQALTKVQDTIQLLSQRQMSNGAFSYWPSASDKYNDTFASIYALHFLTEARDQGYVVPNDLMSIGISYLKDFVSQNAQDAETARLQAYAIYILTRNEIVTTNYLTNLQLYLDRDKTNNWQKTITGAYLAATYKLLKSETNAEQLIRRYQVHNTSLPNTDFYNANLADAQYLYLISKHFPDKLPKLGNGLIMSLVKAISSDELNTLLSGYASLALTSYGQANQPDPNQQPLVIRELLPNNQQKILDASNTLFKKAAISENAKQVIIDNPDKTAYFYQLTQAGFNKQIPAKEVKQGLEIYREYLSPDGKPITNTNLGTEIEVRIKIRALDDQYVNNIAITDLLPGGFEVVNDSVNLNQVDYADLREDRALFFIGVGSEAKEIRYHIKATSVGKFIVPPIYAESMYYPAIQAQGKAANITVDNLS